MIRFLSVDNLAVVDRLDVELGPGLTVLTGETGAGKSVVVGALDLLFGGRASADLIRTGQPQARVQSSIEDESGTELVVRREISSQGRSRAFVDDALATVGVLRDRTRHLIDLHGQHDHQALLDSSNHLALLDAYGTLRGHVDGGGELSDAFHTWHEIQRRLSSARSQGENVDERREVLKFQRDEIERVSPDSGEDDALAEHRARLANAARLRTLSEQSYAALYESDDAILPRLSAVWRQLDELTELDSSFKPYQAVRAEVDSRLEDLAFFLRGYSSQVDDSPEDLEQTEDRLNDLERLKRRYGGTLTEVLARLASLRSELETLESDEGAIAALVKEEANAREKYLQGALARSKQRKAAAQALSVELQKVLQSVAIPQANFIVQFAERDVPPPSTAWTSAGVDAAEFYFSANEGEVARPLTAVASGGELSRVMLGLKTLAATEHEGKTLVFDEVDAGIGGVVADRVGAMLQGLSTRYQVICVTHSAQIAAYATTHLLVSKKVKNGRTSVELEHLVDQASRVAELARMMAGRDTEATRAGAADLLQSKQAAKSEGKRRKRKSLSTKGER